MSRLLSKINFKTLKDMEKFYNGYTLVYNSKLAHYVLFDFENAQDYQKFRELYTNVVGIVAYEPLILNATAIKSHAYLISKDLTLGLSYWNDTHNGIKYYDKIQLVKSNYLDLTHKAIVNNQKCFVVINKEPKFIDTNEAKPFYEAVLNKTLSEHKFNELLENW